MSKILISVERDSVCMGNDCNAPHTLSLKMSDDMTLTELFLNLANRNYLAKVAGKNHSWVCFIAGNRLAKINGNNGKPEPTEYDNCLLSDISKHGVVNVRFKYYSSAT